MTEIRLNNARDILKYTQPPKGMVEYLWFDHIFVDFESLVL